MNSQEMCILNFDLNRAERGKSAPGEKFFFTIVKSLAYVLRQNILYIGYAGQVILESSLSSTTKTIRLCVLLFNDPKTVSYPISTVMYITPYNILALHDKSC